MKKYIYIVYEIDKHHTKSTFCIKGLSTTKKEAKQFFKEHKKATAKEVLKANEFYNWFQNLGGNLTHFNAENIINSCSNTALKFSSFKANPEDTKKRLNHKFNFNL